MEPNEEIGKKKPHRLREIGKGLITMPWTVGKDLVDLTQRAPLLFPLAAWQGAQEERLALQASTRREKDIGGKTMWIWVGLALVTALAFFFLGTFGDILAILVGFVFFCARFGWWDPVREIVTKRTLKTVDEADGATSGEAMDTQVFQQEVATYKLDVAMGLLKEWNKLNKIERGVKAPELRLRLIEHLSRPIGSEAKQGGGEPPASESVGPPAGEKP